MFEFCKIYIPGLVDIGAMTSNLRFLLGLSKNVLYWRTIFKFSKIYMPALADIGVMESNLIF